MKLKRLTAMFVLVAMMATMLFGCSKPADNKTTAAPDNKTTEAPAGETDASTEGEKLLYNVGTLPIVNEPVTLKVLTVDQPGYAYEETEKALLWGWLEEKTGIHFEVESYPAEELAQKLPLIMATPDDHPDLLLHLPCLLY